MAKKVEALNGKTIGYSNEPCKSCKDIMAQGFLLIGVVESKTTDHKNSYRSGNQWGIKKEAAIEMFGEEMCKKGVAFIDVLIANEIGLPGANINA